jgi:hypothetical protein
MLLHYRHLNEIIYTFVAGVNGPTETVDGSLPMLARPDMSYSAICDSDMTLLNIRYV